MTDAAPVFVVGSFVAALSMKVARLPDPGESLAGEAVLLEAGGKGLNVAIALRRLGLAVDGIVAIGSDRFAEMAADALAKADLPDDMLVRFPGSSGTGVGLIDARGENMIAVYPGANALLSADEIMQAEARITTSSAVVTQFEIGDAPIAAAFAAACRKGVRTILNPSPYRPISPAILGATDLLVVNATEAAALLMDLTGETAASPEDLITPLAEAVGGAGVGILVVTLGENGAALRQRNEGTIRQTAFPVDAADATGCGDAFLAGLVAASSRGNDWADALRFAAACGAITCRRIGVVDALPYPQQIDDMIGRKADSA
jgi:ribokinase